MIDRAFDRVARVIELALALAFIFAVLLNFANVIGRYLLGISLIGSDEVQIFIMVAMTFNTDMGDSWEREGEDPEFFQLFSPPGYALGINVLLYSMIQ